MVSNVPRAGKRRVALVLPALLIALGLALSSCATGSGFVYVSSSDRRAYFKIPDNWRFFDKRDLLVASGQSLSAESNRQLSWLIGYDASPKPSIQHILSLADAPSYPVVTARVQSLPFQVRDELSLATLRNWVYPVDRLIQANLGEMISYKDVVLPGGLHGSDMTFDVVLGGVGNVAVNNQVIRVTQEAIVDPPTNRLYLFVLRCESHCYRDNKTLIDQIAQSWTVKEH